MCAEGIIAYLQSTADASPPAAPVTVQSMPALTASRVLAAPLIVTWVREPDILYSLPPTVTLPPSAFSTLSASAGPTASANATPARMTFFFITFLLGSYCYLLRAIRRRATECIFRFVER